MKKMKILSLAMALSVGSLHAQIYTTADPLVAIPDNTSAFDTCQTITVPAPDNVSVGDITVEVTMEHTWVGDLSIRLESPASTQITVMTQPGVAGDGVGNDDNVNLVVPITFSDTAESGVASETMGDAPCVGMIDGSADCPASYTPGPTDATAAEPAVPTADTFATYVGEDSMGVWTLCIADDATGDTGNLSSWRLGVDTPVPVELQSFSID